MTHAFVSAVGSDTTKAYCMLPSDAQFEAGGATASTCRTRNIRVQTSERFSETTLQRWRVGYRPRERDVSSWSVTPTALLMVEEPTLVDAASRIASGDVTASYDSSEGTYLGTSNRFSGFQHLWLGRYSLCPDDLGPSSGTMLPITPLVTEHGASFNADLPRAEQRLRELAEMPIKDGASETTFASLEVVREAGAIIRKLASLLPDTPLPLLGLDTDGTIVMTFDPSRSGAVGSLSVFGDGTYAFYIERDERSCGDGEAKVSRPIPAELQELLTG